MNLPLRICGNLRTMTVTEEEVQERINNLASALISSTPERFTSIDCRVEQVPEQCTGRYSYSITSDSCAGEVITVPTAELHEAAWEAIIALGAEGINVTMAQEGEGWSFSMKTAYLDTDNIEAERDARDEAIWNRVYEERETFFQDHFGAIPQDINKLMTVHWPGGGLFDFSQDCKLAGKRVQVTCGLSNPDMPSSAYVADFERVDEPDGNKSFNTRLARRVPAYVPPHWAGYGYEVGLILADPADTDSMAVLTWVVENELNDCRDIFGKIVEHGGITVQDLRLFDGSFFDFLFMPAQTESIPSTVQLSNGLMQMVIATRITRQERDFAKETSCGELLKHLIEAGVGQVTDLKRLSVIPIRE